jgi:hypothetical protein
MEQSPSCYELILGLLFGILLHALSIFVIRVLPKSQHHFGDNITHARVSTAIGAPNPKDVPSFENYRVAIIPSNFQSKSMPATRHYYALEIIDSESQCEPLTSWWQQRHAAIGDREVAHLQERNRALERRIKELERRLEEQDRKRAELVFPAFIGGLALSKMK